MLSLQVPAGLRVSGFRYGGIGSLELTGLTV